MDFLDKNKISLVFLRQKLGFSPLGKFCLRHFHLLKLSFSKNLNFFLLFFLKFHFVPFFHNRQKQKKKYRVLIFCVQRQMLEMLPWIRHLLSNCSNTRETGEGFFLFRGFGETQRRGKKSGLPDSKNINGQIWS